MANMNTPIENLTPEEAMRLFYALRKCSIQELADKWTKGDLQVSAKRSPSDICFHAHLIESSTCYELYSASFDILEDCFMDLHHHFAHVHSTVGENDALSSSSSSSTVIESLSNIPTVAMNAVAVENIPKVHRLLVVGEVGCGKRTFISRIAKAWYGRSVFRTCYSVKDLTEVTNWADSKNVLVIDCSADEVRYSALFHSVLTNPALNVIVSMHCSRPEDLSFIDTDLFDAVAYMRGSIGGRYEVGDALICRSTITTADMAFVSGLP